MQIQHQEVGRKGAFFIEQNGEWIAEMTYTKPAEDKMVIDHTEVDEQFQGKNIGESLVQAAVEFARTNKLKIIPKCLFTKKVLEENEEYRDVL